MDKDSWRQPPWPTLDVYKSCSGELIIEVDFGEMVTGDQPLLAFTEEQEWAQSGRAATKLL
jgi:hypothetical protein